VKKILILANETIAGKRMLDAMVAHRGEDVSFHIVVPKTRPRHGNVIYDEAVRSSAQVRVDLARAFLREQGIKSTGEVGDPDPFLAATDAIAEHDIDEIIVSTLPAAASGWLRRDLPGRLREETGLPVELVVVDQTMTSEDLVSRLKELADEGPRRFIAVVPQPATHGGAVAQARERLEALLKSLVDQGIVAGGMIGDPDPYTAIMNAVQYFNLSEIVISTLPADRSKWMADKLVDRVRSATNKPVEHIESQPATATA
jgi:hypothetical protein